MGRAGQPADGISAAAPFAVGGCLGGISDAPGQRPAAALWLLRGQLAAVYVFAGIAKLNGDWLLESQPLHIWLQDHTGLPLAGPFLGEAWTAYAFSWGGALFDLTIVDWLLWRRTRPFAYAALGLFHLTTYMLFPQIGVFPWLMTGAALIFLSPGWPRRVSWWLRAELGTVASASSLPKRGFVERAAFPCAAMTHRWLLAIIVAVYVAVQVALPLRHYAYPGNVRWNEEGYRFAWRVLLTEKAGMVEYRVYHPPTSQTWRVGPEEYLTPLQAERMATQPDMILETAHIIARHFSDRGFTQVRVCADAFVTMNGMESARLIDPDVDLAKIRHGLASETWLLPER